MDTLATERKFIFSCKQSSNGQGLGRLSLNICRLDRIYSDQEIRQCLGAEEIEEYVQKSEKRKAEIFWSRLMAKKAISDLYGKKTVRLNEIRIAKGFFKNPLIKGDCKELQVSIAHCNEYAGAIAYPEELILGMDMETTGHGREKSIWQVLSEREKRICPIDMEKEVFALVMWTAKEALVKFMKLGLMVSFEITQVESIWRCEGGFWLKFSYFHGLEAYSLFDDNLICTLVFPGDIELTHLKG